MGASVLLNFLILICIMFVYLITRMEIIMFRLWAKIFTNNHLIKDIVICDESTTLSRTQKIFAAIDKCCVEFDLSKPIWLDANITDFKRYDRVRFTKDNFIDSIDFDYLEIHVIEE